MTLENGENEFKECVEMINKQVTESYNHVIVSGLNELDAHLELGKIWNMDRGKYRLLVKIDADSILMSENSLERILVSALIEINTKSTRTCGGMQEYIENK